jgi:hypothetical protein
MNSTKDELSGNDEEKIIDKENYDILSMMKTPQRPRRIG